GHVLSAPPLLIEGVTAERQAELFRRHAALPVAERSPFPSNAALRLASVRAACHRWRSATTCRSRRAGSMWSGSPGLTGSQGERGGRVAETPSRSVSQFLRSARWSARVLPDQRREVRTRRPA